LSYSNEGIRDRRLAMTLAGLEALGDHLAGMNDPLQGMDVAAADARGAYTLGFYAMDSADKKWRRPDV
jgi:hypothetical protein